MGLRRTNPAVPAGKEEQELYSLILTEMAIWDRLIGGGLRHSQRISHTEGSLSEGPSWSLSENSGINEETSV